MSIQVDVAILGGGPAGYTAAIRAAQAGKTVALVEKDKIGGTCLHRGCIPTKALLKSAEVYRQLIESAAYGLNIAVNTDSFQFSDVQGVKLEKVNQLHKGLQGLMKRYGIQILNGKGRVIGPSIFSPRSGSLAVELDNGETESVVSKHLIIATGSTSRQIKGLEADGTYILTSDHILEIEHLPKSILIVGGGVIGVEWASLLHDFGVEVTIVELGNRILPGEDSEISLEMSKLLTKRGIRILTGVQLQLESYAAADDGIRITAQLADGSAQLEAEKMLISIGREANCHQIGLENTDVALKNGVIAVNEYGQTTEPHIYAVGDVVGGLQLAHAASHEAIVAVDHILGRQPQLAAKHQIPRCIYSYPEVASYGYTEAEAIANGFELKKSKVPFAAIGKAIIQGETTGFVKVIANKANDDILGVHIIGGHATEMISEAVVAGWLNASPWEVGNVIHAHPTLTEAIMEAMLAIDGQAISL